ncbi:MAG TPA: hypothetical protein VF812_03970 [Ktedonobacterales bacterium]
MYSQHAAPPSLYSPDDVYRDPYAARMSAFLQAGLTAGLQLAREDTQTTALVLVDYQHDFIHPMGTLAVPGARDDVARLLSWFYANAGAITHIYASLDTHLPSHIFYSAWWIDPRTGAHPDPFTTITVEDVEERRWTPVTQAEWSERYVRLLRRDSKKDLMIWPPHTMDGTAGHSLAPALSEAIAWHSAARRVQPTYLSKGRTERTEFYGIFGAEIPDPDDPASGLNTRLMDAVMSHDRVYLAGEAKSHCVLETLRQLSARYSDQPETLRRLYVLADCMSSVAHPVIDFDALANTTLDEMRQRGVRIVSSADAVGGSHG